MRNLFGAYFALIACTFAATPTPSEPLPLDYFLAPTVYRLPKLSLDGRYYGIVVVKDNLEVLTTVDLATGKATPVTKSTEMKFVNYWWKSGTLVLLLLEDAKGNRKFQTFDIQTQHADLSGAFRSNYVRLVSPLFDDPENVLVSTGTGEGVDLRRYNIRTGKSEPTHIDSAFMALWITNQKGQPLAGLGRFHKRWFMTLPTGLGQPWRRVELDEREPPDFTPMAVAQDQHRIIGIQSGGTDTARVVAWNPTDDSKETIWQSADVDPDHLFAWEDDWTRMSMVAYETDRPQMHYLDPADQDLAREIDAALPGTTNTIVSTTLDKTKMILRRQSDRIAGEFYLFDRPAKRIAKLGSVIARSEPARLVPGRYFTCKARDGLLLHGRIYSPPGSGGHAPTVLIVTDLTERTRFTYQPYCQLLASRGYAAVEIDQRGTRGYGEKFAAAGDHAVAGAMTDDLIDGLDWLIREGLIDANRIAIQGRDRGGLLAIQTLRRYPNRFAAWVNFWTPMLMNQLQADDFIFGRYSEAEIKERFGGESARIKYLETLDPILALPQIKTPSFHYYPRLITDNSLTNGGERLEKYFAKANPSQVFLKGEKIRDESEYLANKDQRVRDELRRLYAESLKFLAQTLPAHLSPPATTP